MKYPLIIQSIIIISKPTTQQGPDWSFSSLSDLFRQFSFSFYRLFSLQAIEDSSLASFKCNSIGWDWGLYGELTRRQIENWVVQYLFMWSARCMDCSNENHQLKSAPVRRDSRRSQERSRKVCANLPSEDRVSCFVSYFCQRNREKPSRERELGRLSSKAEDRTMRNLKLGDVGSEELRADMISFGFL